MSWSIWTCDISEFEWEYNDQECCFFLEGEVSIKTDFETIQIKSGDYVVFPKGLKCHWNVIKPIKKHYIFK